MKIIPVVLVLSFAIFSYTLACRPILRLYESECCGDDYVEVAWEFIGFGDEANLTAKGIRNNYLHTCPEGVWLGYASENFTGSTTILSGKSQAGTEGKAEVDGLNSCSYQNTGRKVRSVKLVGSKADYSASALVMYSERYNQGPDTTYLNDTRYTDVAFNSFLLIGNEELELFTNSNFAGLSICIRSNIDYINSWQEYQDKNDNLNGTSLFTYVGEIDKIFGTNQFHSFRFGCGTKTNTLINAARYAIRI